MKNPFRAIGNFFRKTVPQGAKSFFTKTLPSVVNKIPSPVLSVATGGVSDIVKAGIASKGNVREFGNQLIKGQAQNLSQIGALGTKVLANPVTGFAVGAVAPELLPALAGGIAFSKGASLAGSTLEKARTAKSPGDVVKVVEGGIKVNQQVKKIK
jgi:hypothetical protein